MITGIYKLTVNPNWQDVRLQEVFLECDTTLAPVIINLFEISELNRFWNVKIVISDPNNNAGTNSITINTSGTDTLDTDGNNQIVLNTNGESVALQVVSEKQWLSVESVGGGSGSGGVNSYKMAKLPASSRLVSAENDISLVGEFFDLGTPIILGGSQVIKLSNGNLALVDNCQSILKDGTHIYYAYDVQTVDPENGYWIAYRPSLTNPNLLVKVSELKMTTQFWNNWYDWTVKDGADNEVKFVTIALPSADATNIEGWITKLTYSNGTLTAVDTNPLFGGATVLSLYNSLTGLGILTGNWDYCTPEYILDDDYYGMGVATDYGWTYFRNAGSGFDSWKCVGFNVLTGQTRYIDGLANGLANITNFTWTFGSQFKDIGRIYSHPNGLFFTMASQQILNNGDNVNNVSAVWSPYWTDNTEVIYLNARDLADGKFLFTGTSPLGFFSFEWYWDNNNFYTVVGNIIYQPQNIMVTRYNIDTKAVTIFNLPNTAIDINVNGINGWANNNSAITFVSPFPNVLFGEKTYILLSNTDPIILQTNNSYPTQMVGSKAISSYSSLDRNTYSVGAEVDEWGGVQF